MLCLSLSITLSNTLPQQSISVVPAPLVQFASSLRHFLEKRRKSKVTSDAGVPMLNISFRCQPRAQTATIIDLEDLKALRGLYDALHDPSTLDAWRNFRYGLTPHDAKTPPSVITLIVNSRCSRIVLTPQVSPSTKHRTVTHTQLTTNTVSRTLRVMNAADFQVLRFLGEGTSGKVYLVRDRISKANLALKVIPKKGRNDYALNAVLKERNISVKLANSPWFVDMWAAWHDKLYFYIAMTLYPTDLDSEIIRCGVIDPNRARFYMAEIIIALTELHSRGIIHRDIKAPNILIDKDGHVVLADFGLSKDFHKIPTIAERVYQPYWPYFLDDNPTSESELRNPEDLHFVAWSYRGSDMEMAPEIHLRMPYSFGIDFWSASVILYWMLTGRPPFYEDEAAYEDEGEEDCKPLMYKIAEDDLHWDESDNVDEVTKDFLERMMAKDPKQRLMISFDIPTHPYFVGVNWTLMEKRLVIPPWIPGLKIGHLYEDVSPTFSPGETYLEVEDPFPEFFFYSKRLRNVVLFGDGKGQEHSEEETFNGRDGGLDNSSCKMTCLDELQADTEYEVYDKDRGLKHDYDNFDLMATWDISIISPPATKPQGPGQKAWIHGLDLLKFFSAVHVHPHRAKFPHTISLDTECSTTRPAPKLLAPLATPCQTTHIVNGAGLVFKLKVWFWKTRRPKHKTKSKEK